MTGDGAEGRDQLEEESLYEDVGIFGAFSRGLFGEQQLRTSPNQARRKLQARPNQVFGQNSSFLGGPLVCDARSLSRDQTEQDKRQGLSQGRGCW